MSLADTGAPLIDTGAPLSLYSPDIPATVAAPSFDPNINYLQSDVPGSPGSYDPTGYIQSGPQAVDATQAGLVNQQAMVDTLGTEDANAYASTLTPAGIPIVGGVPQYFNPSGTLVKNATALTGAQDTVPVNVGSGGINAWLHGITDAVTSLVKTSPTVDTLSNVKNPTTTQGTSQPRVGLLSPLTSMLQTPPLFTAPTVGGQGGSMNPLVLLALAFGAWYLIKHG